MAHITSVLQPLGISSSMASVRMCLGYAETRPQQQEAYKELKRHLDKVGALHPP